MLTDRKLIRRLSKKRIDRKYNAVEGRVHRAVLQTLLMHVIGIIDVDGYLKKDIISYFKCESCCGKNLYSYIINRSIFFHSLRIY